ncbi:MAG: hypothetical protein HYU58_08665 [Proteobacteria bacterium]|nr:hypothetical protein [Pseudomonadota bacterium]
MRHLGRFSDLARWPKQVARNVKIMPPTSPLNPHRRRFHMLWRRLRCWILPPKKSVFLNGRWHDAVPAQKGPPIAIFAGCEMPEWWTLECGRVAEFVGIYDGRPLFFYQPPTRPGEVIIGQGIYRVSVRPQLKTPNVTSSHAA